MEDHEEEEEEEDDDDDDDDDDRDIVGIYMQMSHPLTRKRKPYQSVNLTRWN